MDAQDTRSDYTTGQRLYAAGEMIDACTNAEQRRGFMAASNACADAGTGFWLKSRPHQYVSEPQYVYERM